MPFAPKHQRFQRRAPASASPPPPPRNLDGTVEGMEPIVGPGAPQPPASLQEPPACLRHPDRRAGAAVFRGWEWELLCLECAEPFRRQRYRP